MVHESGQSIHFVKEQTDGQCKDPEGQRWHYSSARHTGVLNGRGRKRCHPAPRAFLLLGLTAYSLHPVKAAENTPPHRSSAPWPFNLVGSIKQHEYDHEYKHAQLLEGLDVVGRLSSTNWRIQVRVGGTGRH